ncbi:uncharacterized protein LOC124815504 isoform X2 [Hydra vulgaris]|uniref:uncharacterized protein LOC124815504 isoform X2 n=1 Tax=Hydra vulgaris TaxID=6087 RepID=UPI0032E9D452
MWYTIRNTTLKGKKKNFSIDLILLSIGYLMLDAVATLNFSTISFSGYSKHFQYMQVESFKKKLYSNLLKLNNILVDITAQFSNDPEEGFTQRKISDELNVLKRKIANIDIQYIAFVLVSFIFIVCKTVIIN